MLQDFTTYLLAALNIFGLSYFTLLSSDSSRYSFNHITFLNNIYKQFYNLSHNSLEKIISNMSQILSWVEECLGFWLQGSTLG